MQWAGARPGVARAREPGAGQGGAGDSTQEARGHRAAAGQVRCRSLTLLIAARATGTGRRHRQSGACVLPHCLCLRPVLRMGVACRGEAGRLRVQAMGWVASSGRRTWCLTTRVTCASCVLTCLLRLASSSASVLSDYLSICLSVCLSHSSCPTSPPPLPPSSPSSPPLPSSYRCHSHKSPEVRMELLVGMVTAGFAFGFIVACCWTRGKEDRHELTVSSRVPF